MNHDAYKNKGLTGLANLGNTCFINACLQVLSHTYELNDVLDTPVFQAKIKKNQPDAELLVGWDNLRKLMWSENCVISPKGFIRTIHKIAHVKKMELFTNYSQNDVGEFLLFLIDCFHNAVSREINITISGTPSNETDTLAIKCFEMIQQRYKKDYSEIWNLFYGVHISEISRKDTRQTISSTPEPYFMIDLPIPPNNKSPSLIDCLDHYCKGEIITSYKEETTNELLEVEKKIIFWSFPTILTIDLKRFNSMNLQKNQTHVSFPTELDLSNYVIGYKKKSFIYELYGVCNHSGNVYGGHYTAYIKNANGKWYHCNDTTVTEVKHIHSIVSSKAYLLFYRKKSVPK